MSLITLFSAPKPFTDPHIAMIQRSAIKSWTLLPDVDIILLGEETGLAEATKELGVKYIPHVERSPNGVPLISSMFKLARENSNSELFCIINADMVLMPDFVENAKQAAQLKDKFVLLSQRWDYDITLPIDFADEWQSRLREDVRKQNQIHRPAGSDFFLFPKSCYADIPNFIIGRAGWDNWMIYKARKENWAVIDCTPSVMIVHQNHDYAHLPGGKPHYEHPETNENIRLAGGQANVRYTILDATHQLVDGTLARPKMSSLRFTRKFELFLRTLFFFLPENMVENVARPKRWKKRLKKIIR
ncbi:MAG TPA: hypothetical protein PKE23_10730 [Anaerolineales bacterium]|nr:hypothetical protein [Anaerolineales bacterium]HNK63501.1 hypothetical protein [Anaerolineales bacterium]HNM37147.1 hypothetical protein [Anaerolineales bacterium]